MLSKRICYLFINKSSPAKTFNTHIHDLSARICPKFLSLSYGGTRYHSTSPPNQMKYPTVKFSKLVHTGDTQMLDILQGGLIIKMLESAADIAATKHCLRFGVKSPSGNNPHPALVGVERMEILSSAKIGDLLEFMAKIVHVKSRSLRIHVDVFRTYFVTHERRLMVRASLWYVPISENGEIGHFEMTQEEVKADEQQQKQLQQTQQQQQMQQLLAGNKDLLQKGTLDLSMLVYLNTLQRGKDKTFMGILENIVREIFLKPEEEKAVTMYSITPSHCSLLDRCKAGEILRWMDEFAGVLACKYAGHIGVTGSLDNCVMSRPVPAGSCVTFLGRPVFTSNRTIDIQVIGCVENQHNIEPVIFSSCFFTFVSRKQGPEDNSGLLPLEPKTEEEKLLYDERKTLYTTRKVLREKQRETKGKK